MCASRQGLVRSLHLAFGAVHAPVLGPLLAEAMGWPSFGFLSKLVRSQIGATYAC